MIAGLVNANREATIRLLVRGPQGHQQEIEAIIDTGFTGFLTLPPMLVTTLGLAWLCRQPGILADGRVEYFDVYVATVIWDSQPRTVEVEAADTEPLVGMSLRSIMPCGSTSSTAVWSLLQRFLDPDQALLGRTTACRRRRTGAT